MFQTNLAEHNLVFPEGSAFFVGCPPAVLKEALELLPYEHRFETVYKTKSGGRVNIHSHISKKADWDLLMDIAKQKADLGHTVDILPTPHAKEKETREKLLPGYKYHPKNPDFKIDGEYVEVENDKSGKHILRTINAGAAQADRVIVAAHAMPSQTKAGQIMKTAFKNNPDLKWVEIRVGETFQKFKREDFK